MSTKVQVHVQRDQHDAEDVMAEPIVECPECAKLNKENQNLKEEIQKLKEPSRELQGDITISSFENGEKIPTQEQVPSRELQRDMAKSSSENEEKVPIQELINLRDQHAEDGKAEAVAESPEFAKLKEEIQKLKESEDSACCMECAELFWDPDKCCPVDCELKSICHLLSVINIPFCPRKLEKHLLLLDFLSLSKGMPMLQPSDLFNCTTTVNSLYLHGFLKCVLEIDVQKDDDIKDVLNRCYKELNDTVGLLLCWNTDSSAHCVTIVRHEGEETFHIADAQKEEFFPECLENVGNIETVYVLQLTKDDNNERKIEQWKEMCGITTCWSEVSKDPTVSSTAGL